MKPDLTALVNAARQGDSTAYTALYNATAQQMLGRARAMVRSDQDALDLLQESYLYAFRSLDQLEHPEYFTTWLYRIVTNRCKNFLTRSKPRLFEVSLTNEEGEEPDREDEDITFRPDESLDYTETKRLVRQAVDSLPDDQRTCILLHYFQNLKVSQIAQALEVPENTVKSRLSYARKKLMAQFQALEKQGTKLYAVPFFPFLSWMLSESTSQLAARSLDGLLPPILGGLSAGTAAAGAAAASGAAATAETAAASGSAVAAAATGEAAAAGTAAATGASAASAAATAAGAAHAGILGAAGTKAVAGIVAAAVVAGGGVAASRLLHQEPPEEPAASQVEVLPEGYVFWQELTDPAGTLDPQSYHVRLGISEPAVVQEYYPETQELYITVPEGGTVTFSWLPSFEDAAGGVAPYDLQGDDPLLYWTAADRDNPLYGGEGTKRDEETGGYFYYGPLVLDAQTGSAQDTQSGLSQTVTFSGDGAFYLNAGWSAQTEVGQAAITPTVYIKTTRQPSNPLSFQVEMPSLYNPDQYTRDLCVTEPAQVTDCDLETQTIYITAHVGDEFEFGSVKKVTRPALTLAELKAEYKGENPTPWKEYPSGSFGGSGWSNGPADPEQIAYGTNSVFVRVVTPDGTMQTPEGEEYSPVVERIAHYPGDYNGPIRAVSPGTVAFIEWHLQSAKTEEGQWYSEPQSPQWEFRISYVITVLP